MTRVATPVRTISLHRALLGTFALAMLAGFVPASIILDRRLAAALEDRTRIDLALAPRVLVDRMSATSDAMMMHAKDVSQLPGLADALARRDRALALQLLDSARPSLGGMDPLLVAGDGAVWLGPTVEPAVLDETRAGHMPVTMQRTGGSVYRVALAPVKHAGKWVGAVGLSTAFDDRAA
ncbi:MAG: hypothetical protein ABI625_26290, partial [bacterium]